MRIGFLILAAGLLVGCGIAEEHEKIDTELDTQSILCQLKIALVAIEVGSPQEQAKDVLAARERCKDVLSNDARFEQLAATHLIEQFDDPTKIKLKDILLRENPKAPYQKELAGKISVKNDYGDFGDYKYFNLHIDNATFKWVVNFE